MKNIKTIGAQVISQAMAQVKPQARKVYVKAVEPQLDKFAGVMTDKIMTNARMEGYIIHHLQELDDKLATAKWHYAECERFRNDTGNVLEQVAGIKGECVDIQNAISGDVTDLENRIYELEESHREMTRNLEDCIVDLDDCYEFRDLQERVSDLEYNDFDDLESRVRDLEDNDFDDLESRVDTLESIYGDDLKDKVEVLEDAVFNDMTERIDNLSDKIDCLYESDGGTLDYDNITSRVYESIRNDLDDEFTGYGDYLVLREEVREIKNALSGIRDILNRMN